MPDKPRGNVSRVIGIGLIVAGLVLVVAGFVAFMPIAANLSDSSDALPDFDVDAPPPTALTAVAPTTVATRAVAQLEAAPTLAMDVSVPQATETVSGLSNNKADEQAVIGSAPASIIATPAKRPANPATAQPQNEPPRVAFETPRRIVIPAIKLDSPVEEAEFVVRNNQDVGEWQIPMRAAGWHNNSAMLGDAGNVVMSGHNNIGSRVFANLRLLKPDDEIIVKGGANDYRYRVVERKLLLEKGQPLSVQYENASYILPDLGDNRLTLVTCWPPTNNTYRLIVIAKPLDEPRKGGT